MLNPAKHIEISTLGMNAVFGYTKAAINAVFETNERTLAIWTELAKVAVPKAPQVEETWEWSGSVKRPHSTLLSAQQDQPKPAAFGFEPWAEFFRSASTVWWTPRQSPFAWWAWSPQSALPATWPWAYGMMASGVPGSVAWPVAEANQALLEAAKKTAEVSIPVTFPTYQSAGGFATAQVWMGRPLLKSILTVAPATTLIWPWLERAV